MFSKETLIESKICTLGMANQWYDSLAATCERFGIDTPLRQAGFLSQMAHESGGFQHTKENLNYSVEALVSVFGTHRISMEEARLYGRINNSQAANQEMIANIVYGGEWGAKNLGNTEPGDGWKFIGRGLVGLTGKTNYLQYSLDCNNQALQYPQIVEMPHYASEAAGWFWDKHGLNALADTGSVEAMTKRINGGYNGLADRKEKYEALLSVLSVA